MSDRRTPHEERRNSFDAVRISAALCVLIGHQFDLAGYYLPGFAQPVIWPLGLKMSDVGLYVFFALSGYLIRQSLAADPRPGRFIAARVLRIYPGAVVNTLLCVVFGAVDTTLQPAAFWHDPQTVSYLAHNLPILNVPTQFQLPGVLADARWPAVNVPIWTLKYELLSYILLLVVDRLTPRRRAATRGVITALAVASAAGFVYIRIRPMANAPGLDSLGTFYAVHLVRFLTVFFAGAMYAAFEPLARGVRLSLAVALGGLILLWPSSEPGRLGAMLLVVLLAIEVGRSPYLFSRLYRRIGDLSYGTYLYAFPIQLMTLTRWLDGSNFALVTAADIGLTLGCAFLSWHLVERPALRFKRGRRSPLRGGSSPRNDHDGPPGGRLDGRGVARPIAVDVPFRTQGSSHARTLADRQDRGGVEGELLL